VAAAIVAWGAASALGLGRAAFDVGQPHQKPANVWSTRAPGKPFGRALACDAARADRPQALLRLGLEQLAAQLDAQQTHWRKLRLGVVVGTSSGGFAALERALAATDGSEAEDFRKSPYFAPLRSALEGLPEPERLVSLYAACASSTLAIGLGLRWLELGEVELVIAGGYDAESDWVCAGFDALKATSPGNPRPFRAERDGMALGEGVALVALARRHERAYGYVRGFAATTDAVHITAPDRTGRSLARAAEQALASAAVAPTDIDFVSVHGTGTTFNDAAEAAALRLVFREHAAELELHAFKSVVGHTLGAAGALESLAAVSALENAVVPASASVGTPMAELPARVLEENRARPVEHCLKLSTAFGGANAALVLSRRLDSFPPRLPRPVYLVAAGEPRTELDVAELEGLLVSPLERLPRSDTLSALAVAASAGALRAAGASEAALDRLRTGVIVGSVGASLQANEEFSARLLTRGREHAEPRRFPATSPNACAGHVAIAFGLGGPSHAVGAGAGAALEALFVAYDWLSAGDADWMLVVGAEQAGQTARRALLACGLGCPEQGAFALLLSTAPTGKLVGPELRGLARSLALDPKNLGFRQLEAWCRAAGLPGPGAFGSVRPPE
jgi:3-oxoacyl-[acyl-carrier-protein] synthase II